MCLPSRGWSMTAALRTENSWCRFRLRSPLPPSFVPPALAVQRSPTSM
uniref:Uncharacterized protein n=1 Tax=Anguilla anguilla TaxID=7936 RepID=A0A0E9W9S0_ANGAN